jgi:hypothetical protein
MEGSACWLALAADKHPSSVASGLVIERTVCQTPSNCGKFFFTDWMQPTLRFEHVHRLQSEAVHDWKFNVLKIDFMLLASKAMASTICQ